MKCDYCGSAPELVTGAEVYPHLPKLRDKWIWRCQPCKARVGCHPGTQVPLGRLANAELREAKQAAHAAFDPVWKDGHMKRGQAYSWLAERLGIHGKDCHIGMMNEEQCRRVVELCKATKWGKQGS